MAGNSQALQRQLDGVAVKLGELAGLLQRCHCLQAVWFVQQLPKW
jgi:hypothetical protein